MVDPPIHSVALLESYGIPARLIDAVMVTHCHADHDGGTLQKILAETQCTVISTTAILKSFIRKYSLLTNLEEEFLNTLFIARPDYSAKLPTYLQRICIVCSRIAPFSQLISLQPES